MLAAAEEIARAAQGKVLLCNLKAVSRPAEGLQAFFRLLLPRAAYEHAVALRPAAAHAAAQLVQLAEAEAFKSAGIPVLLILVIQGSIWINYGIPTITSSPLFFLSYLVVSSIQMGANIDYAIVTTSRFMEFKDKMPKKDAIIETMNLAFPTIITSGLMMVIAGILIGQMTSNAAIAGIGDSLGRGTIITIIIVMFILPQILLLGEKVIDKTSFDVPTPVSQHQSSGRVRIDGMVRGEIRGQIHGIVHAYVDGDVNISLLSGQTEPDPGEDTDPAPSPEPEAEPKPEPGEETAPQDEQPQEKEAEAHEE